jgi:uncharacterized protein (TIGR00251 family)
MYDPDYEVLSKCISRVDGGVVLEVYVRTKAKTLSIEGVDKWRYRLNVNLKAKAVKDLANRELIYFLSFVLNVPSSNINIIRGKRVQSKSVSILELNQDQIVKLLLEVLREK